MLIKNYFSSQMTSHVWGVKIKIQGITVGGFLDAFGEAYALRGPLKCVIAESFTWSAADQWDHTNQTIIEQHDEIWSEFHLALTETSLEAAGTLKGNWGRLKPLGGAKGTHGATLSGFSTGGLHKFNPMDLVKHVSVL